tara:strand:- start:65 stop:358 length:294 start_codon:yes stop_codon:yes gene_type:complete
MNTENETQKEKFTALLEWVEDVKFNGTEPIKLMVETMFEAWLSTGYAANAETRNAYLHDTKLMAEGVNIISCFTQADFNQLQQLIQTEHVSQQNRPN